MEQGCFHDTIQSGGNRLHMGIYAAGNNPPAILFIPGMGCHAGIEGARFEVIPGSHALPLESIPALTRVAAEWFGETFGGSLTEAAS